MVEKRPNRISILAHCGLILNLVLLAILSIQLRQHSSMFGDAGSGSFREFGNWLSLLLVVYGLTNYFVFRSIASRLNEDLLAPLQVIAGKLSSGQRFQTEQSLLKFSEQTANLVRSAESVVESLVEAREREQLIADHALDVICSLDTTGLVKAVNPAVFAQWGYLPFAVVNRRINSFISPNDIPRFENALNNSRETGSSKVEIQMLSQERQLIDTAWRIEWSTSLEHFFCVISDISDRKNLERAKQEFVQMVGHDLKTPLSSVQITLEALKIGGYGTLNEKGTKGVQASLNSINRVMSLIHQLLDLDRAESGNLVLDKAEANLSEVLDSSRQSVEELARRKNISLHFDKGEFKVLVDKERIIQVMVNLLSNALKFSNSGSTVSVRVEEFPDSVKITVSDQGRGIPKAYQSAIFDRFIQVNIGDSTKFKGSGLGLPICKMLIEAHGSKIQLVSAEESGSSFSFFLERADRPSFPI